LTQKFAMFSSIPIDCPKKSSVLINTYRRFYRQYLSIDTKKKLPPVRWRISISLCCLHTRHFPLVPLAEYGVSDSRGTRL